MKNVKDAELTVKRILNLIWMQKLLEKFVGVSNFRGPFTVNTAVPNFTSQCYRTVDGQAV